MARIQRLLGVGWVCLSGGLVLAAAWWCSRATAGDLRGLDFIAPYSASRVILRQGFGRAYDAAAQRAVQESISSAWGGQPFLPALTPPPFLAAQAWLGLLPIGGAYAAWLAVSSAALLAGLWLLASSAGLRGRARGLSMLAVFGSVPSVVGLWQGQTDGVLVAAVGLAAWLGANSSGCTGAALLLLLVKPQASLAAAALPAARGPLRTFAVVLAGCAGLAAVALLVFGPEACLQYLRLLSSYSMETKGSDTVQRYSLTARAALAAAGLPAAAQLAVLGVLLLLGLAAIRLRRGPWWRDLGLAVVLSLLVAPHLNSSDLVLLSAAAIPLGTELWRRPEPLGWAVLGGTAAAATLAPYVAWPVPILEVALAAYLWWAVPLRELDRAVGARVGAGPP